MTLCLKKNKPKKNKQMKHSSQGQQVSVSLDLCFYSFLNMLFAEAVAYDFDALVVALLT